MDGVPDEAVEGHGEEIEEGDSRECPSQQPEDREDSGYALYKHKGGGWPCEGGASPGVCKRERGGGG